MMDILLDRETDDLLIENGDFVIGRSDEQQQKLILIAEKGEWKEFPELGVGIDKMLDNEEYNELLITAKKNLKYDGMQIRNISFNPSGKLHIDGNY